MNASHVLDRLHTQKTIAIVRTQTPDAALWLSEVFLSAGINTLEITWTTPHAASVVAQLKERFPKALIGAGTILNPSMMQEALSVGADFFASPGFHPLLLYALKTQHKLYLPGVYTPTEIMLALDAGAEALKLFPFQSAGGVEYLKLLQAPFPSVKIIPTGGVSILSVPTILASGAWAVGLGGCLVPSSRCLEERQEAELRVHLSSLLQI
jgi:2-dehydro-3-deoxyphosphogluconate aldolase / (4S)-4-hydroxy-2-oxoglutarate aldolase